MNPTSLRQAAEQARQHSSLDWLDDVRRRAVERFLSDGFPTTAEEDWRYTDLRPAAELTERLFRHSNAMANSLQQEMPGSMVEGLGGPKAVFMDGAFRADLSSLAPRGGLTLAPLGQVAPELRATAADRISRAAAHSKGLTALNAALIRDGLFVEVADGTILNEPIYIVLANSAQSATYNRVIVTLGRHSRATVIEHHISAGESVSNSVTEVACDVGSGLTYVKLQAETVSALHLASQSISVARDAQVDILHLDIGSKLARNDLRVDLVGEGSGVTSHGLFYADGSRHLDNHTRIDHQAAHTRSREQYRGIADENGRGIFNGKIIVHSGAIKSDAELSNRNLLLSRTAEIDTKPELEIYADDVQCSHGATTGQLDPNAIFYLRSRGIATDQAQRLLMASFVGEIVKRVPAGPLNSHLVTLLHDRLPDLGKLVEHE